MGDSILRLNQFDTVLHNTNSNPLGAPESVKKAIINNMDSIVKYPDEYYTLLKKTISNYSGAKKENIIMGCGSSDLLRLFPALIGPKKVLLISPSFSEYQCVLSTYGCEIDFYNLDPEKDFVFDVVDFVSSLNSSYDYMIIGNPNNPTSSLIEREDLVIIANTCKELGIFLIIDEMYIEFVENYEIYTFIPHICEYDNVVILRSVSKFFALSGMRFSYAIYNNPINMEIINMTMTPNAISILTAIGCDAAFRDSEYILQSKSLMHTERNLVFSAMSASKNIKLYKPNANFMLVKLLKEGVDADFITTQSKQKGIILRNCSNIRGLDGSFIRFCFMKPAQNDALVNTILGFLDWFNYLLQKK